MKRITATSLAICLLGAALGCAAGCGPEDPETEKPDPGPQGGGTQSGTEVDTSFHALSEGGEGQTGGGETYVLTVGKPAEKRNYLSVDFEASVAVRGEIAYTAGGSAHTEDFYALAGKNDFRQILDYYGEYGGIETIDSLSFLSLTGEAGTVKVNSVSIANHAIDFSGIRFTDSEVEPQLQLYLKGEQINVGCTLKSGGAINWLSSPEAVASRMSAPDGDQQQDTYYVGTKKDAEAKANFRAVVTEGNEVNLVNTADNGRLIQQSYYGALDDENYQSELYNGAVWPYNPVQGGSQTNKHSLLTDVRVSDGEIYIKTRPLDWAKDKSITPSYMENRYTLQKSASGMEYVRVENKFTDFSGYRHGNPRHQELPAFYCISPLGRAIYYTGAAPFTGAALSESADLGFWGAPQPPESHLSCDENWIVWANEDDWGVGLYVPDVTSVLAGRYNYDVNFWTLFKNGAYRAGTTCYCAPLATLALQSYTAFEYSYYLSVGRVEESRALFCSLKEGGASNGDLAGKAAW